MSGTRGVGAGFAAGGERRDDVEARLTSGESYWPAPAKLNLFLHVTGRRADGYHDLQTVFQLVDLCDDIVISVRDDGEIERPAGAVGVSAEDDLVVRAARALKAATGTPLPTSVAWTGAARARGATRRA